MPLFRCFDIIARCHAISFRLPFHAAISHHTARDMKFRHALICSSPRRFDALLRHALMLSAAATLFCQRAPPASAPPLIAYC